MAFIGNTNTTQAFTPAVDFFSGNASTTAFTLSRPVASVAQVQAVISNVPQDPGSAYTVSGNTITFTSAPPSGTNNIYVYYTSPITQVIAPGQGTVDTASLSASLAVPAAQLTGTQTIPKATLPTGSVLQVVQATYSTSTSTSGGTYVDSGLSASITPTSSTSKILISTTTSFYIGGGGADNGCQFQIMRGATSILAPVGNSVYLGGPTASTELILNFPFIYLDSPATTSSTTYKVQMLALNGATVTAQNSGNTSVIVLMEIAA